MAFSAAALMLVLIHIGMQQHEHDTLILGHNGGPPLDDDLTPLEGVYSLTISDASRRTGLSRSRIYRYLDAQRLRSFKVGKARLILARSLVQLLRELAESPEGAPRYRHAGGRFAPSPKANAGEEMPRVRAAQRHHRNR
jgi:excisionase family DNA binding protein